MLTKEELKNIQEYILEIDKPGAVIAVFDEGKVFARYTDLGYQHLYYTLFDFVFHNTRFVRIRVGGYSFRAATMALNMVKHLPQDRIYLEYLSNSSSSEGNNDDDPRIKVVNMGDFNFNYDMDIVKAAEEYDFKSFGDERGMHTMVYYYVNNIETGFYDNSGEFHRFYSKSRGLQAIADVVMIKGFEDITPATAVMCTFTFDNEGNIIIAGNAMHRDRRSRTSSQRMLISNVGIRCIDLTEKTE
jgi:hypothetical protein